jgi:hypothetical protein
MSPQSEVVAVAAGSSHWEVSLALHMCVIFENLLGAIAPASEFHLHMQLFRFYFLNSLEVQRMAQITNECRKSIFLTRNWSNAK